jgi:hypothetical protein
MVSQKAYHKNKPNKALSRMVETAVVHEKCLLGLALSTPPASLTVRLYKIGELMRTIKLLVFFTYILCISACSSHYALLPTAVASWEPSKEKAVVLVALVGPTLSVYTSGNIFPIDTNQRFALDEEIYVAAIVHKTGKPFKISRVDMLPITYTATKNIRTKYTFDDLPEIEIVKPGIYYYGLFYLNYEETAKFIPKHSDKIIKIAQKYYPAVFEKSPPINFKLK